MEIQHSTKKEFPARAVNYESTTNEWVFPDDKPVVDELAEKYRGKTDSYKADTDRELSPAFGIETVFIPTEGKPHMRPGKKGGKTNRNMKSTTCAKRLPLLLAALLLLAAVRLPAQEKQFSRIVAEASFRQLLEEIPEVQLVDVRRPDEYREGHLPGAANMDVTDGTFAERIRTLDRERPVLLYCRSGVRSNRAARILSENGFHEIYELEGGFLDWHGETTAE